MRTDVKIGILLGVVLVLAAIGYFMLSDNHGDKKSTEPVVSVELPSAKARSEPKDVATRDVKKVETRDAVKEAAAPIVAVPKPEAPKPAVEPVVPKPVEVPAAPVVKDTAPDVRQPRYHTVQKGESLCKIAELYYGSGSRGNCDVIYNANKKVITKPDVINPGWKLRIPYPEEVAGQN
jgi:nucleoid-associated protein YgaU